MGSLDSGLREGVLNLEPLEQSVLDTLLVARPMEGIMETDPAIGLWTIVFGIAGAADVEYHSG